MQYYEQEIDALNKSNIRYLIIGGLAVNLHGLHRLTMDLDLMIDLSKDNFGHFVELMGAIGYATRVPKEDWGKHDAIAFRHNKEEDKRIDVFLKNPMDFEQAYKNRKVFSVDNLDIPCIGFDDLIALKDKANRVRDWIDVGSLKRIKELKESEKQDN